MDFGPDSSLSEAMGYLCKSERQTGLRNRPTRNNLRAAGTSAEGFGFLMYALPNPAWRNFPQFAHSP